MNVDLTDKSICELCFDRARASDEEVLVASRVKSLNASNNCIVRIIGLDILFCHLVQLNLAHNNLGGSSGRVSNGGGCAAAAGDGGDCVWMDALPPSLQVLNLSHNRLTAFASKRTMIETKEDRVEISLKRLRYACPITLALFFNRERFPHLQDLDLSYNALNLTLDESDGVEEMWQRVVEDPAAVDDRSGETNHSARWSRLTTSAVTILRLDGNPNLSALNGVLCGMEALTHLYAANSGVSDLIAVSAAATFCPKLHALDMHGSPVVDAFMHAPRSSIATFLELLLLPFILLEEKDDKSGEELEKRSVLQSIVREVAQQHLEKVECALANQEGFEGNTLAGVLYAALLQQVIPQVVELDEGVDVNAARQGLLKAAREVLEQFIENYNRPVSNSEVVKTPYSKSSLNKKISLEKHHQPHVAVHPERQGKLTVLPRGIDVPQKSLQSPMCDSTSSSTRGREMMVTGLEGASRCTSVSGRSHSAKRMLKRAAASAAQLRPAVVVTGSTKTTMATNTNTNTSNTSTMTPPGNDVVNYTTDIENRISTTFSKEYGSMTATSSINASNNSSYYDDGVSKSVLKDDSKTSSSEKNGGTSHAFHTDPHFGTIAATATATATANLGVGTHSENSNFYEEGGMSSRFQRALAALTPMLAHRLRSEGLSAQSSASAMKDTSQSSKEDYTNSMYSTSATNSNSLTAKDALLQQAQTLERALLTVQDRQRGLQESVSQLKEQLRHDRRFITDQRKETTRLRMEINLLMESNKRLIHRVKKRQKDIVYGANALRRREAVAQRKAALERIEREEKSLQQAERRLREKVALSGAWSHTNLQDTTGSAVDTTRTTTHGIEVRPLRKTRADLLRENAVQERMAAKSQEDPFSYCPERFRVSNYGLDSGSGAGEGRNGFLRDANSKTQRHPLAQDMRRRKKSANLGCGQSREEEHINGKTTWRKNESISMSSSQISASARAEEKRSMYDKGLSPYDDFEKVKETDNHEDSNRYSHNSLQGLSLQQLFEEAAAIQKRQRILHQRKCGMYDEDEDEVDKFYSRNTENGEHDAVPLQNDVHNDNNNNNLITCMEKQIQVSMNVEMMQELGKSTKCATDNDASWSSSGVVINENRSSHVNEVKNCIDSNLISDDVSVDVLVSVTESHLHEDLVIATMSPTATTLSTAADMKNERCNKVLHQCGQEPEQQFKNRGEPLTIPLPRVAEEHFSADARQIYNEILSQHLKHQKQKQQQQHVILENVERGGKEKQKKEGINKTEQSSCFSKLNGSSIINESCSTVNEKEVAEEASSCCSSLKKNT